MAITTKDELAKQVATRTGLEAGQAKAAVEATMSRRSSRSTLIGLYTTAAVFGEESVMRSSYGLPSRRFILLAAA